jgi:hypothetical protein
MGKTLMFSVIAVSLATSALLSKHARVGVGTSQPDVRMAANGAYRDGLYVGRFAAESGRPERPQIGRWSTVSDRASFAAGYTSGYHESAKR